MLQIRDLTVTMKKDLRDLLRGFTFALNPGDKAAIIGGRATGNPPCSSSSTTPPW